MKPEEAIEIINGIENLELRIVEDEAVELALEALNFMFCVLIQTK